MSTIVHVENIESDLLQIAGHHYLMDPATLLAYARLAGSASLSELDAMRVRYEAKQDQVRTRREAEGRGGNYTVRGDGRAVIPMVGAMTKRPNCMADFFGDGSASTLQVMADLKAAKLDPDVEERWVVGETPGGEVGGAFDLAAYIRNERGSDKPIHFYAEDQSTSGGVLVMSQTESVWGNHNVVSGSLGVYTTLVNSHEAYKQRGVEVILVKAGKHKGIGAAPGLNITKAQIEQVQMRIDSFHALFKSFVQAGYGMSDEALERISDAGVYVGEQGVEMGILDGIVSSLDEAIEAAAAKPGRKNRSTFSMTGTNKPPAGRPDTSPVGAAAADAISELIVGDVALPTPTPATVAVSEDPTLVNYVAADGKQASMPVASVSAILSALATAGVGDVASLTSRIERALLGDKYVAVVTEGAKKMLVAAHGPTAGPLMAAKLDSETDFSVIEAQLNDARGIVKSQGFAGKDAARVSAPSPVIGQPNTTKTAVPADATVVPTMAERVQAATRELREEGIY